MRKRGRQLEALLALAFATSAWSQTANYAVPAASVGHDFAAYHQALDYAADEALANVKRDAEIGRVATSSVVLPDATMVHKFAQQYWNGNDEAVRRAIERVTQLRPVLSPILDEEGVPGSVAALVLVESAGKATAQSSKGARGIWQFMPETARRYGLTVNSQDDERLNVPKSTHAAARYLRDLFNQFGNWPLAFAAYNAGEKLVEKASLTGGSKDFSLLSSRRLLPAETREYVPAVLAASNLLSRNNSLFDNNAREVHSTPALLYAGPAAGNQQ